MAIFKAIVLVALSNTLAEAYPGPLNAYGPDIARLALRDAISTTETSTISSSMPTISEVPSSASSTSTISSTAADVPGAASITTPTGTLAVPGSAATTDAPALPSATDASAVPGGVTTTSESASATSSVPITSDSTLALISPSMTSDSMTITTVSTISGSTASPTTSTTTSSVGFLGQIGLAFNNAKDSITGGLAPLTYDKAIDQGRDVVDTMTRDPDAAKGDQSTWTDPAELGKQNWVKANEEQVSGNNGNHEDIAMSVGVDVKSDVLPGSPDKGYTLNLLNWTHGSTESQYYLFDSKFEIIYSNHTHPGDHPAPENHDGSAPSLNKWDDVSALVWQQYIQDTLVKNSQPHDADAVKAAMKNLKGIAHLNIGPDTSAVIAEAFQKHPDLNKTVGWPGNTIVPRHPNQFNALMGTPAGQEVGTFLAARKDPLGWKTIDQIQIFCPVCDFDTPGMKNAQWRMVFRLANKES